MTYFRMGIHTIIGAGSFHCPVRDGKEWDQTAMVAKHKLSNWQAVYQLFIYYFILSYFGDECIHQQALSLLHFVLLQSSSNDRVKPHEQLVWVSCTRCRASTPHLSTSWSRTTLQEGLTPREVSSPGRFRA